MLCQPHRLTKGVSPRCAAPPSPAIRRSTRSTPYSAIAALSDGPMKPAAERVMQQTGGFRMQCKECEAAARRRQTRRMDVEGRERCAQGRQATNRRCVLPRGVAVAVVRLEILITLYPACLPAMHGSHRSEPCSASAFEDGVRRVPCCAGCDRLAESVGARMRQPEYVALLRWRCM
jgi:hypothetical protein